MATQTATPRARSAPRRTNMLRILLVEDNERLRPALARGLEETGEASIVAQCASGEEALRFVSGGGLDSGDGSDSQNGEPSEIDCLLMDVCLAGERNGIETAVAIRAERPRMPVVFYSIQDDDEYFRQFCNAGILSHYAYVKKSNYLLPDMILPLLRDSVAGRSFIDPEIETRVQQVRKRDSLCAPIEMLEPNERRAARMLALGMSNQQIAERLGFRDKRTVARINGQIYSTWGLNENAEDEKVARTRAALIVRAGRMIAWDDDGAAHILDESGDWVEWNP